LLASQSAGGELPIAAGGSRLVGSVQVVTVPQGNTLPLEAFAAQYGQGLSNMLEANPGVDPFLPKAGSELIVPQQDFARHGASGHRSECR
jgi:L,D-transpeptidase ErfK/SrfK